MRFVKFSVLLLIICTCCLQGIFMLYRKGYKTYYSFEQQRLNEIINGKDYYDAVFIGSSRTVYHINPEVVDSTLHIRSFNAGIDGANIVESRLILECYLASHPPPKYVIADVAAPFFEVSESPIWNANIYYPFLNNKIIFRRLKPFKRVYLLKYLPFLQLTECDDFLRNGAFAGLLGNKQPLAPHYDNGYIESGTDTIPLPFKNTYPIREWAIQRQGISIFKEIIEICKKNNIRLFVTYAPVYNLKDGKMNAAFFPTLKYICDANQTTFLNYRYLSINTDNRLFRDEIHLNTVGANIYSNLLARDIKEMEAGHDKFPINYREF
jgi:hypothetical protein